MANRASGRGGESGDPRPGGTSARRGARLQPGPLPRTGGRRGRLARLVARLWCRPQEIVAGLILVLLSGAAAVAVAATTALPAGAVPQDGSRPASAAARADPAPAPPALPRPAQRVVSLAPHLTELVYAAGAGDRLVGVTRYSDYPPAARALPQVGDAFAINLEALARLQPDLILAWRSALPPRQRARLLALGIPVWETEIDSVDHLADVLTGLGRVLGTPAPAAREAARLRARWAALRRPPDGAPVRVFFQVWDAPLMTFNGRHLVSQAVQACGGVNPFADLLPLTLTVSWEAAVRADPELIVSAESDVDALRVQWARYPQVAAVRRGQVVGLKGDLITRMGPRFIDGAQALCAAIEEARRARAARP